MVVVRKEEIRSGVGMLYSGTNKRIFICFLWQIKIKKKKQYKKLFLNLKWSLLNIKS